MPFIRPMTSCLFSNKNLHRQWNMLYVSMRLISMEMKEKMAAQRKKLRDEFDKEERKWELLVDLSLLNDEDVTIYEEHKAAIIKRRFTYDDPGTGYRVMTRLRHFYRGSCCGNACRHCVYNHDNVAEQDKVRRIYNSAFWVDRDSRPDLVKRLDLLRSLNHHVNEDDCRMKFRNEGDDTEESTDPLLFKH